MGQPCIDFCGNGRLDRDWDGLYAPKVTDYIEDWQLVTDVPNNKYQECDDGNTIDGDGCSSICLVEDGYHCWPIIESIEILPGTDANERVYIKSNCTLVPVANPCNPCPTYFQLTNREELAFTGNLVDKDKVTGYLKIIDLDDASYGVAMTINSDTSTVSKTYITTHLAAADGTSASDATISLDATEARVR